MSAARHALAACALALVVSASLSLDAHKPITSPYTFAEDVLPILRDRCSACHVGGGPAPMALTTVEETVPWGESIRLELIAGHMPPWSAMSGGRRLPHAEGLTARELNVLLTWATGGTPPGEAKPAAAEDARPGWPLGQPDATIALPEVTVAADQTEITREFVLPIDAAARRPLRAVDLQPGTRSLVRSARVTLRPASSRDGATGRVLALWVPGDQPIALPPGAAFALPPDAEVVVTVRFKKNWEHERDVMTDRSTVGLYFAADGAVPVAPLQITMPLAAPPAPSAGNPVSGIVFDRAIEAGAKVLAISPTEAAAGAAITIDAVSPNGGRLRVLEFTPRRGWERRYWLEAPAEWARGTRLQIGVKFDGREPAAPSTPLLVLDTLPQ